MTVRTARLQVEECNDEPKRQLAVSSPKANPDNEVYREPHDRKTRAER